ncbi:hypothetical protein ACLB1S_10095 [Escherichia coli]
MPDQTQQFSFKVLTINIHKGFTAFNRRFILPELRDAVRTVSADIVCLQEVMGAHEVHPLHVENWPDPRTTSFSPTRCGAILPTVAMPYTRKGITATPYCRVIPLNIMRIAMFRSNGAGEARRALLPHCATDDRKSDSCDVRTSGPA